jgi:hypothetical protein
MMNVHPQKQKLQVVIIGLLILLLPACLDQRFELGNDMPIDGQVNPAFALPLAQGQWSVQQALNQMDSLNWSTDPNGGTAMLVQPFALLQAPPIELPFINEFIVEDFSFGASAAQSLSNLPAGETMQLSHQTSWGWELPSMDVVDSLWFSQGLFSASISSDLPMNHSIEVIATNVFIDGAPMVLEFVLDYAGATPQEQTASVNMANASGVFNSTEGVQVLFDWAISVESNGMPVDDDANISIQFEWQDVFVSGAFGKFGSQTSFDFELVQALPLMADWNPDQFHVADPRIRLNSQNSSGIPLAIQWDEFAFTSATNYWPISGPDIMDFPVIAAAPAVGIWSQTEHVIDNSGTVPTLTETFELRPDSARMRGQLLLNPEGQNSNFLTSESTLVVDGSLEIPLTGWANGLTWRDTIAGSISKELNAGINPPMDWQDLESITIRFIAINGWPLGMGMQAYFLDGSDELVDSLYVLNDPNAFHIRAGLVDESLSSLDLNYGRVLEPTQTIMDLVLTREKAIELLTLDCQGIELVLTLATPEAQADNVVRFFPEDLMDIKVSARVDFAITIEP